jgi:hypothetical protein
MYRSNVVLPLPSGPVTNVMGVRSCISGKSECRNPKSETMFESQNPNDKNLLPDTATAFSEFGFLSFEFVWDFDIRISNFAT